MFYVDPMQGMMCLNCWGALVPLCVNVWDVNCTGNCCLHLKPEKQWRAGGISWPEKAVSLPSIGSCLRRGICPPGQSLCKHTYTWSSSDRRFSQVQLHHKNLKWKIMKNNRAIFHQPVSVSTLLEKNNCIRSNEKTHWGYVFPRSLCRVWLY